MKKKTKYMIITIITLIIILLFTYGFSYAKYISNAAWNYYLKSNGFYFNSDYLGLESVKNVNNHWDGESINFNIKNSDNNFVATDYDISYNVTCTIVGEASSYSKCELNGTNSNSFTGILSSYKGCSNNTNDGVNVSSLTKSECESNNYEWKNQTALNDLYFDIIPTGNTELNNITVNITATSSSPYHKTLIGEFTLKKSQTKSGELNKQFKEFSTYDRLTVSNSYNENKCVKLSFDSSKLRIDVDESKISSFNTDTNGYIDEIIFKINKNDSKSYMFYQTNFSLHYNQTDFELVEVNSC